MTVQLLVVNQGGGSGAASGVTVTPAGTISSTNAQAALQELDADIQALGGAVVALASNAIGGPLTDTTAVVGVNVNRTSANIWWVVSTSASVPTSTQIKAGQIHTGAAAGAGRSGSTATTLIGFYRADVTGLTLGTDYYAHFWVESGAETVAVSSAVFNRLGPELLPAFGSFTLGAPWTLTGSGTTLTKATGSAAVAEYTSLTLGLKRYRLELDVTSYSGTGKFSVRLAGGTPVDLVAFGISANGTFSTDATAINNTQFEIQAGSSTAGVITRASCREIITASELNQIGFSAWARDEILRLTVLTGAMGVFNLGDIASQGANGSTLAEANRSAIQDFVDSAKIDDGGCKIIVPPGTLAFPIGPNATGGHGLALPGGTIIEGAHPDLSKLTFFGTFTDAHIRAANRESDNVNVFDKLVLTNLVLQNSGNDVPLLDYTGCRNSKFEDITAGGSGNTDYSIAIYATDVTALGNDTSTYFNWFARWHSGSAGFGIGLKHSQTVGRCNTTNFFGMEIHARHTFDFTDDALSGNGNSSWMGGYTAGNTQTLPEPAQQFLDDVIPIGWNFISYTSEHQGIPALTATQGFYTKNLHVIAAQGDFGQINLLTTATTNPAVLERVWADAAASYVLKLSQG